MVKPKIKRKNVTSTSDFVSNYESEGKPNPPTSEIEVGENSDLPLTYFEAPVSNIGNSEVPSDKDHGITKMPSIQKNQHSFGLFKF